MGTQYSEFVFDFGTLEGQTLSGLNQETGIDLWTFLQKCVRAEMSTFVHVGLKLTFMKALTVVYYSDFVIVWFSNFLLV